MEWIIKNWLTVLPLIGSFIAWGWASWDRAKTARLELERKEWARLGELVVILHNGNAHGHWAQIASVIELRGLSTRKETVLRIAKSARAFWSEKANPELLDELDKLIAELES